MPRGSRRTLLCAALGLALPLAGCITRPIDHKVFEQDYTTIYLRSYKRGTSIVEKGYQHPFTIAPARMAHILSRIDLRREEDGETKRTPAIPTDSIYLIGQGLAEALAEADENQQVMVMSIRREKRLGIFDRKFLTSLIAYRKGDQLYIHLGSCDWAVPPSREDRLPEPQLDKPSAKFRVIPSRGMALVDTASVAVDWRDPIFAKETRTRVTPSGKVVRRTILMESPEQTTDSAPAPAQGAPQQPALPPNLSPQTLRDLADLEDARRRGELTESQYEIERRRILGSDPGRP